MKKFGVFLIFFGRALGMFSGLGLADANLRMLPALPVNGKLDFLPIVVDGGDDILHQRSQQPMPEPHINVWGIPSRFEIVSQAGEIRHGGVLALVALGLIAGVWGMNFDNLPFADHEWGVWIILGLMLLTAAGSAIAAALLAHRR